MDIVDLRDTTKSYRVRDALERAIPLLPKDITPGIRKVVLLDADYHGDKGAAARYVPIKGTNRADVEMYFAHYDELPEEIIDNHVFIGLLSLKSLFHELYHHMLRFQKKKAKPGYKKEQRQTDNWAEKSVMDIMLDIYPFKENRDEYDQICAMGKKVGYLLEV